MALPLAPQLIVNSRMLYFCWVPEDPAAAAALLPEGLEPAGNRAIFINQYVVDGDAQTSHFGAYSLTYAGLDLAGLDLEDGTPGRWWTHYLNSNPVMRDYAAVRGVPAVPGRTTLTLEGDRLTATTFADDRPVIRSVARVGAGIADTARGHLRYITAVDGRADERQLRLCGRTRGRVRASLARIPGAGAFVPRAASEDTAGGHLRLLRAARLVLLSGRRRAARPGLTRTGPNYSAGSGAGSGQVTWTGSVQPPVSSRWRL